MVAVYRIINLKNAHSYVGLSCDVPGRIRQHIKEKKSGAYKLYQALRKYGIDSFAVQIIGSFEERQDARDEEKRVISFYNSYHKGYNCSPGGDGTDPEKMRGTNSPMHREDIREKVSESSQYRIPQLRKQMIENNPMNNPLFREKVRLSKMGIPRSIATKERISRTRKENNTARGELNPAAKLTSVSAREIYNSLAKRKDLAIQYGVSLPLIDAIKQGRVWKHIGTGDTSGRDSMGR